VRQLLSHTSGLADYAPEEDETFIKRVLANHRKAWQPRDLVAIGTAQRPLFAPGALVVLQHERPRGDARATPATVDKQHCRPAPSLFVVGSRCGWLGGGLVRLARDDLVTKTLG
jgi:hypothetical protein